MPDTVSAAYLGEHADRLAEIPVEIPLDEDLVARIMREGPMGMSAVARRLGKFRDGANTSPSTPARWHGRGLELEDGTVLHLEAIRLNGRLVTSWPAVLRFVRAQQTPPAPAPNLSRSPAARARAAEAASVELDRLGVR